MGTNRAGRLLLQLLDLKYYTEGINGEPPLIPIDGEFAYDYETGDVVVFRIDTNGNIKIESATKDLKERFRQLEVSGVFSNAEAFVVNRKIYRMYFDQIRNTIRLDPELRFEPIYRYYAVRKIEKNEQGFYEYVTGVKATGPMGEYVVSNLVDMDLVPSESGDGSKVSKPCVGGLIDVMYNAKNYIVEFYDEDRILVNMIPFQAIAVKTADIDMTPDNAIIDIFVSTNRPYDDTGTAAFLYQYESIENLDIRVFVKYRDGRVRDISHERVQGGRLVIEGLDTIDTSVITAAGQTPQHFTVKYFMIASNDPVPPGGDPNTLTITKDVGVYIKEDVYDEVDDVVVAGYIEGDVVSGIDVNIKLTIFGVYKSGRIKDITNFILLDAINTNGVSIPFDPTQTGVVHKLRIRVPQGHANTYKTFVKYIEAPLNQRYCIEHNQSGQAIDVSFIVAKPSVLPNPVFNHLIVGGNPRYIGDFASQYTLVDQNNVTHTPNKFRVRSVFYNQYTYTDFIDVSTNMQFAYVIPTSSLILTNTMPLLVEFAEVTTGPGGLIIDVKFTGAKVCYVTISL